MEQETCRLGKSQGSGPCLLSVAAGTLSLSGSPCKCQALGAEVCSVPQRRGLLKAVLQTVYLHPGTALSFSPNRSLS